ncbi:MAG: hypothetical protein LWW85_05355 [Marinilabiliales bacterium]|nr:hypothetical protein [Marinilabiliales bacterium]
MTFSFLFSGDHHLVKMIHTAISMLFALTAITLFCRSLLGFFKRKPYLRTDTILSWLFIVTLYLQLAFGLLLMVSPEQVTTQELAEKMVAKRFWPVEHIILMLFALFIANLGLVFSVNAASDRLKHRKVLVYYSIAILMILLSLGSTYLR